MIRSWLRGANAGMVLRTFGEIIALRHGHVHLEAHWLDEARDSSAFGSNYLDYFARQQEYAVHLCSIYLSCLPDHSVTFFLHCTVQSALFRLGLIKAFHSFRGSEPQATQRLL